MLPIERPMQPRGHSPRLNSGVEVEEVSSNDTTLSRIPMATLNIISQDALNLLTNRVWNDTSTQWTPREFFEAYPTEIKTGESIFDVDTYRTLV